MFFFFILAIRALASKLVEQWLKALKGEQVTPISVADIPEVILDFQSDIKCEISKNDVTDIEAEKPLNDSEKSSIIENDDNDKDVKSENDVSSSENIHVEEIDAPSNENDILPVLKITLKNGKQILSQVEVDSKAEDNSEKEKNREKHKSKNRDKSQDKSSSSKESSSSSKLSSSSRHSSSSSKSSDKGKSSSHKDSSSKHSSKDKYKDKDRHSSHSSKSKSSSSSSSKKSSSSSNSSSSKVKDGKSSQKHSSDKDKSREKDSKSSSEKSDKTQTPIQKLGKIPKLSDLKKEKPSISIEIRKPDEPKPKTVKTFHSKFRNHGLAEEVKPPPSRAALLNKKPPPAIPPTVSIPKRPSPVHNETPPEKKPKTLLEIDKPGAIKLIPPKHKREYSFNCLFFTFILIYFLFTGHKEMHLVLLSNTHKKIIYGFKCGKSKMNNLTGLIFVQKLLVKYLFLIKVKFDKKKSY